VCLSAESTALELLIFFTGFAKFSTTLYGISISMAFAMANLAPAFFKKAANFSLVYYPVKFVRRYIVIIITLPGY
jgi:hypothetical protein